jgi:hypothetical protein
MDGWLATNKEEVEEEEEEEEGIIRPSIRLSKACSAANRDLQGSDTLVLYTLKCVSISATDAMRAGITVCFPS